jgi:hypothetical protein
MCDQVGCGDGGFVCHQCRECKPDVVERFVVNNASAVLHPDAEPTSGYRTHLCSRCDGELWLSTRNMSEAEMLAYVGTDAQRWAQAFVERFAVAGRYESTNDNDPIGLMIGWFANAIEVGRDAGAKRSVSDDT